MPKQRHPDDVETIRRLESELAAARRRIADLETIDRAWGAPTPASVKNIQAFLDLRRAAEDRMTKAAWWGE